MRLSERHHGGVREGPRASPPPTSPCFELDRGRRDGERNARCMCEHSHRRSSRSRGGGHGRDGERDGARSVSPTMIRSTTRGGRLRERNGPRAPRSSPHHGSVRAWEGSRGGSSRSRRGCPDRRRGERDGPRSVPPASPSRPGRAGRLGERDGPRSTPPTSRRSPEREGRQGERDGPRAPPSRPQRGRGRERDGFEDQSSRSRRGFQDRHGVVARPLSSPPTTPRSTGHEGRQGDLHAPPSSPHRGRELEGPARGGLPGSPPTSHSGTEEQLGGDTITSEEQVGDNHVGGEEPIGDNHVAGEDADEQLGDHPVADEEEEQAHGDVPVEEEQAHGDDLIHEILSRLDARQLTNAVGSCRDLRVARWGVRAETPIPFIGIVLLDGKVLDLIIMKKPRPSPQILQSVQYLKGSLIQVPKSHQITECRNGHIVLKSDGDEKFKVWNPYLRRNAWVIVPQYEVHAEERFLVSALLPGETDGNFRLLVLALIADANCTESTLLLVKIFCSSTKSWRVANTGAQITKIIHPYGVHAGHFIYYLGLSQGNKSIVQINSQTMAAAVIPVPIDYEDADLMISRTGGGDLCLCKSNRKRVDGKRIIMVFLFADGQWHESWRHEIPEASYWTRLIGFAEENSLIIVGTGCDEIKTLHIELGRWTDLEDHRVKGCFAVEMDSPFLYPFTAGSLDIDEASFETMTESGGWRL